jgi:hypothetical protein
MKALLLLLLMVPSCLQAQRVRVIGPAQPLVQGLAFQVQYVITEGAADFMEVGRPAFDSCRIVSGPHLYRAPAAEGQPPILNITFTLVASGVGRLRLQPLSLRFRSGEIFSDALSLEVVAPPRASYNTRSSFTDHRLYTSAPAQREVLISENLLLRATADRRTVYVGQPVTATFTIYSALQSESEAVKSPSFYGFSVTDMLSIHQSHTGVETMEGRVFNKAILRKVQLYPEQAGRLQIDPMHVRNTISFNEDSRETAVEKELASEALEIVVKPLPGGAPASFGGAVGKFLLTASLERDRMALNESGRLLLRISGVGNFTQLVAPAISWPKGLEPYDALVADTIDKSAAPLRGHRTFTIPFSAAAVGSYVLPPLKLAYFDPEKGRYLETVTDSLYLTVGPPLPAAAKQEKKKDSTFPYYLLLFLLPILFLFFRRKKPSPPTKPVAEAPLSSFAARLKSIPASLPEKELGQQMQAVLITFERERGKSLNTTQRQQLQQLLADCQLINYAYLEQRGEAAVLKERAIRLVEAVE